MKKLQLIAIIFSISFLFSSCARNYHLELVGHYKPNTDVARKTAPQPPSHSENMIQAPQQTENNGVASTSETQPDLNPVLPPLQQATPPTLNEKQQQKLEKKIEKVKAKVDKKVSQSGKQIQQNDL